MGIFGALYGFVMGLFLTVFATIGSAMIGGMNLPIFGGLSIIVSPIIYGFIGYLSGVFSAYLYNNVIVPRFGGLQIDLV